MRPTDLVGRKRALVRTFAILGLAALGCTPGSSPGDTPDPSADLGGPTWVKSFSVAGSQLETRAVVPLADGGSYRLGVVTDPTWTQRSLAVIRLDANGDVVRLAGSATWARTYPGASVSAALSHVAGAVESVDGHIWVAGRSEDGATVLKLGADGTPVLSQVYDTPDEPVTPLAIAATGDGGFVVAGAIERRSAANRTAKGGDLWLLRADASGARRWLTVDDLPDEEWAERIAAIEVDEADPNTPGVTVCGGQETEISFANSNFWVARFILQNGSLQFSETFSGALEGGTCHAVVTIHQDDDDGADDPALVAVGTSSEGGGDTIEPQLVAIEPDELDWWHDPSTAQDDDVDLGSVETAEGYEFRDVAVAQSAGRVYAIANRQVPAADCGAERDECWHTEGVLVELVRAFDPRVGARRFLVARAWTPSDFGQPAFTTFLRLERVPGGGYLLVTALDPVSGYDASVLRLEGSDLTVRAAATIALPSYQVDLANLVALADGGVLAWNPGRIVRFGVTGAERWRQVYALGRLSAEADFDAAALDGGGVLVLVREEEGSVLLRYDEQARLQFARQYRTVALLDLEPIDRDGNGQPGDQVLAIARTTGAEPELLRLRLDRDGAVRDVAAFAGARQLAGPVSSSGARVLVPTDNGLYWLDRAGNGDSKWWGGWSGALQVAAADGGLWRVSGDSLRSFTVRRYDRDGRHALTRSSKVFVNPFGQEGPLLGRPLVGAARRDGGLFLAGVVDLPAAHEQICAELEDCSDVVLFGIDPRGDVNWVNAYGAARRETMGRYARGHVRSLAATADNGVLMAADSDSYVYPDWSLFDLRLSADGVASRDCVARLEPHFRVVTEAPVEGVDAELHPHGIVDRRAPPQFTELPRADAALTIVTARSCSDVSRAPSLTVTVQGQGSVTSTPLGIACPGDCQQAWPSGTVIALQAQPRPGNHLDGWQGDCASSGRRTVIELTLSGAKTCTARFAGGDPPPSCASDADCANDPRDDGNRCNGRYACSNDGECVFDETTAVTCDPAGDTACQQNRCDPATGACPLTPVADGAGCDDGDACTALDHCAAGACVSGADQCGCAGDADCLPLEDDDRCSLLVCDGSSCVVDPGTIKECPTTEDTDCRKAACVPETGECALEDVEGDCDDGDACTAAPDTCDEGECKGGTATSCPDDGNPCTDDFCDPATGVCKTANNAAACDDGIPCTEDDVCAGGTCAGQAKVCGDANGCTEDLGCDPADGQCKYANNTALCDDEDPCTTGDRCAGGECLPDTLVTCADGNPCTDDVCDPVTGGCANPHNAAPCDDGNACTVGDVCAGGACTAGAAPLVCDDGILCTDDACEPALGCTRTFNSVECDDGEPCTGGDHCVGGACIGELNPCDDGNACTVDLCALQFGGCINDDTDAIAACADQNPCTVDGCDPATGDCTHDSTVADEACGAVQCGAVCNPVDALCTPGGLVCAPPQDLVAVAGEGTVVLTWSPVADATSYRLYVGFAPGVTPASAALLADATSPELILGLAPGLPAWFVVTAVFAASESDPSNEVSATPLAAPDRTGPVVRWTTPIDASLGVDPTLPIRVGFSEPLDPTPATLAAGFRVSGPGGAVAGTRTAVGSAVVFTPTAALATASDYTVTLDAALTDAAGNALATPATVMFTTRPAAPVVTALAGNGAVTLTWSEVASATGYAVHRGDAAGGPYLPVGGATRPSFTDRAAFNGSPYFYVVSAFTADGESGPSIEVAAQPSALAPATPTNLVALPGDGVALLVWDAIPDATGRVWRAPSANGPYTIVAPSVAGTTFRDPTVANGTHYRYVVQAVTAGAEGAWSTELGVHPGADRPGSPTALTATGVGSGWVELTWAELPEAADYVVYARPSLTERPAVVAGVGTNGAVVALVDGTTYRLSAAAIDADGQQGAPSAEISAAPDVTRAPRPTTLVRAYASLHGAIHLDWTAALGATNYVVKRSDTAGGPYTEIAQTGATSYDDAGLGAGFYEYVVEPTANAGAATAGDSNARSAVATEGGPVPPTGVTAIAGNGCITVSWNVAVGASSYYIYEASQAGGPHDYLSGTTGTFANRYTDCSAAADQAPHYYVVTAWYGNEQSELSGEASATASPTLPTSPTPFGLPGNGEVLVTWPTAGDGVTYHLYRRTEFSAWQEIAQPTGLLHRDLGLVNETAYTYALQSEQAGQRGALTLGSPVVPTAGQPPAPTGVTASARAGCVTVTWDVVPAATAYYLYATTGPDGAYDYLTWLPDAFDNQYTDCALAANPAARSYVVTAWWGNAQSVYSAAATATAIEAGPLPPGPSSQPGDEQVVLTWATAGDGAVYRVQRRTDTSAWEEIAETDALWFVDETVGNGTGYTYAVEAELDGVPSGRSATASRPGDEYPPPPTGLTTVPGNGCITLAWDVVPGATAYYVYRSTTPDGPGDPPGGPGGPYAYLFGLAGGFDNRHSDCPLDSRTHHYRVTSWWGNAQSGWPDAVSETASADLPAAPAPFATVGDRDVTLTWPSVGDGTTYHVYRRLDLTPWAEIGATDTLTFRDGSVDNEIVYFYAVQAEQDGARGALSPATPAIIPTPLSPPAPTGVVAEPGDGCVTLSWDAVPGATAYYVYESAQLGGPYSYHFGLAGEFETVYTDCTLAADLAEHVYVVTAWQGNYQSGYSADLAATASTALPDRPGFLSVSDAGPGALSLDWGLVDGALAYRIWRRSDSAPWAIVDQTPGPPYEDAGLTTGVPYSYMVQAFSADGAGAPTPPTSSAAP